MTEPVKFHDTENYAHTEVYVRDTSIRGSQPKPRLALLPIDGTTIKYLRTDNAISNKRARDMMRLMFIAGATSTPPFDETKEQVESAINEKLGEIWNRYATNSNNVR